MFKHLYTSDGINHKVSFNKMDIAPNMSQELSIDCFTKKSLVQFEIEGEKIFFKI